MILIASGTAAGALAGLALALVAAAVIAIVRFPLGSPSGGTIAALVAIGAGLDAIRLVAGRPGPPTAGRQVPSEWARIFPAPTTAALYGARLGVGPLTILSTWTWWSFTVAATLLGPGSAMATGATFGLVKLGLVALMSRAGDGPSGHSAVFGQLRAGQRPSWAAITLLSLALAVAASGCGFGDDPSAGATGQAVDDPADAIAARADDAERSTGRPATATNDQANETGTPDLIAPAELEDVVRTDIDVDDTTASIEIDTEAAAAAASAASTAATTVDPGTGAGSMTGERPSLADDLVASIGDYQSIDGPDADRYLDLMAAAGIQPDPTEEVALLETRGYEGGWLRAFRNEHNDVAVASVYEFRDEVEAEFYLEDGLITIGGYGGTFFDIPDLPGVRGFAQDINRTDGEATEDLVSLGASFHRGDRWYLLYFLGSPERVTPEVLVPAVAAQLRSVGA